MRFSIASRWRAVMGGGASVGAVAVHRRQLALERGQRTVEVGGQLARGTTALRNWARGPHPGRANSERVIRAASYVGYPAGWIEVGRLGLSGQATAITVHIVAARAMLTRIANDRGPRSPIVQNSRLHSRDAARSGIVVS